MSERIIHLDETFLHCREEENSRQYALVFTSDKGCFFRYTDSLSPTVPLKILDNHFGGADRWTDKNGDGVIICTDGWYDEDRLKIQTERTRRKSSDAWSVSSDMSRMSPKLMKTT